MVMEMVLNDLSLSSPVGDRSTARALMTDLIQVLSIAKQFGIKTLRTQEILYDLPLAPNYPIRAWWNDPKVDLEERRFLQVLSTKAPLLEDIVDSAIKSEEELTDFFYQGERVYALGIAYLLDALAVSFHSDPKWNFGFLSLEITRLEKPSGKLETSVESLVHASCREHILGHKSRISDRLREQPWHPQDDLLPCYVASNGTCPFVEWLDSLRDLLAKNIIQSKLNQVRQGRWGDRKSVGEGVWEFRIFYGPAYRIYFAQIETEKLLLLYGGDKNTQDDDIPKAKQHWQDYKKRQRLSE